MVNVNCIVHISFRGRRRESHLLPSSPRALFNPVSVTSIVLTGMTRASNREMQGRYDSMILAAWIVKTFSRTACAMTTPR